MATQKQKVSNDTPSEVVHELRRQFNALLAELESVADLATLQTNLGTGVAKEVTVSPEPPRLPRFPTP